MSALPDLFPGFAEHRLAGDGVEIYARIGGSGPPLLALHGFPQSHVIWHRIAPELAQHFTLVAMDLRGYGRSGAPAGDDEHVTYSKRAMAKDCIAAMRTLGFERFMIAGHDRGGRVAYRLALDHPEVVSRLAVLDIIPTLEVWERITAESALWAYHWQLLAQPAPLPETLLASNPIFYLEQKLTSYAGGKSLDVFPPQVLEHYRAQISDPARVHAMCEDYRAGATIDRRLDAEDRAAGRRIKCPTLALWGAKYVGRGKADPVEIWRAWCDDVVGAEISAGHYLAEENPKTAAALVDFLLGAKES